MRRPHRRVRAFPLASLTAVAVLLPDPRSALAYQERLVHSVEVGRCTLALEADDEARGLRLRVSPATERCEVSKDALQRLLEEAFARTEPPRLEGVYRSLYLGRLVEFPWLAAHLAETAARDPGWDATKGRPVKAGPNAYVAAVLSRPEVTAQFQEAIAGAGYRIRTASVEKVLVGDRRMRGGHGPPGKLPFDAMVWFTLERE